MAKISLGIKDFKLGSKVSQNLTNAGHQVDFIDNAGPIPSDCDIVIIPANKWDDLEEFSEISYILGYAENIKSDDIRKWKTIGFNRIILTSSLSRNITEIVNHILDERI